MYIAINLQKKKSVKKSGLHTVADIDPTCSSSSAVDTIQETVVAEPKPEDKIDDELTSDDVPATTTNNDVTESPRNVESASAGSAEFVDIVSGK